ncbi:MAG: cysteine desulfurase [Ignavibacteria bacterium]|nr:cysteine desulfurase [Ignavibacteria bacterium]
MELIYLDNAATTPIDPRVKEIMLPWLSGKFGNPSSVYKTGREAKVMVEDTRDLFAEFIGAKPSEIYFSSGGTESNNFALKGTAFNCLGIKDHIITSAIEHSSVIDTMDYLNSRFGLNITYLKTNSFGEINFDELTDAITPKTALISLMHSNNELGIINEINNTSLKASKIGSIIVHSDMVQSLGKVNINVQNLGIHLASFSSHKIYGPKGLGILYIKRGTKIDKFMHGGKQERDKRGGTENTAAIAGFSKAVELLKSEMKNDIKHYFGLKSRMINALHTELGNKILLNSYNDNRSLPNILNITFNPNNTNIDADTLLIKLDISNIAVSSGSACTSGSVQPSHVLKAIGYDDKSARSSIRVSFGRFNKESDIDKFIKVLKEIIN